jgi:hypothetical protein
MSRAVTQRICNIELDDRAPTEVAFQQAPAFAVDDIVVVADAELVP